MAYDLERFVTAQSPIYAQVLSELRAGRKQSHWMWYIFPQMKGLGKSDMSRYFGIASRFEAINYVAHEMLGPRLRECTALACAASSHSAERIFGAVDAMKFRSSMTLFAETIVDNAIFLSALEMLCGGEPDAATLALLRDKSSCSR